MTKIVFNKSKYIFYTVQKLIKIIHVNNKKKKPNKLIFSFKTNNCRNPHFMKSADLCYDYP